MPVLTKTLSGPQMADVAAYGTAVQVKVFKVPTQ